MKIKCINKDGWKYLTKDKIYEVIIENDGFNNYAVLDDKDCVWWYPKECFKPLYEIRNEKINKLLE
jgi:hypothetical protein